MENEKIKEIEINGIPYEITGKTAYEIACEHGFKGTEAEWLESLNGKDGVDGKDGTSVEGEEVFDIFPSANLLNPENAESGYYDANPFAPMASANHIRTLEPVSIEGHNGKIYIRTSLPNDATYGSTLIFFAFLDSDGNEVSHTSNRVNILSDHPFAEPPMTATQMHLYIDNANKGVSFADWCLSFDELDDFAPYDVTVKLKKTALPDNITRDLPFMGKTIVNFGDSIFGNKRPPDDISTKLAELTGATVYNCGFGGCRMGLHNNTYFDAFGMAKLATAIATNDFSIQDSAIIDGNGVLPPYFNDTLACLKSIDFSAVDIITIAYGTNDFGDSCRFEDKINPMNSDTFSGALRYSIETILGTYPNIKTFICGQIYRFYMDENGNYLNDSDTVEYLGLKLTDYVAQTAKIASEYKLPFIDNYYSLGFNKHNRNIYFPSDDGTHPNEVGCRLIAEHIYSNLIDAKYDNRDAVLQTIGKEFDRLDGQFAELNGVRLSANDFTRGQISGGKFVYNDTWIITHNPIPVKTGDKFSFNPNGFRLGFYVVDNKDLTVATVLKNLGYHTESAEIVIPVDGYLVAMVSKTDGFSITPNEYASVVVIGNGVIDEFHRDIANSKSAIEEIRKSVSESKTRITTSPKHKPFTNIVNDCQSASEWTVTNTSAGVPVVDSEDCILGSQSLHCDKDMVCTANSYDLLKNYLVLKLKINSISDGAILYMRLASSKSSGKYAYYAIARGGYSHNPVNGWVEISIPTTSYREGTVDGLDFGNIDEVKIYVSAGTCDWNLQYIGTRPIVSNTGIVSFTFDDGDKSQYKAFKLLAEKGITGTLFHITEISGKEDLKDYYLTIGELQNLVNHYNADIEVHGTGLEFEDSPTQNYDDMTDEQLISHWENAKRFLKENGLSDGEHMAYPQGRHAPRVVQLAKRYFKSCRTIDGHIPFETYPAGDNHRIRAITAIGEHGVKIDTVKDFIDKAVASNSWLVLVFHKIGQGTSADGGMYCSEEWLQEIADYAINSGAKIMNFAEVFDSSC